MNMRRILKQPTLRMQAGGEASSWGGENRPSVVNPGAYGDAKTAAFMNANSASTQTRAGFLERNPGVQQTLALPAAGQPAPVTTPGQIMGGGNSFGDAASLRPGAAVTPFAQQSNLQQYTSQDVAARGAGMAKTSGGWARTTPYTPPGVSPMPAAAAGAAPTSASAAAAPAKQSKSLGLPAGFESTFTPMAVPGLKHGGDLRTGMGGHVPGSGSGDKIDAKYEPGEFVVSNDMLDKAPGLREMLHNLRGEALADKGMTPGQADAKAVSGPTLRANNAFGGLQLGYDPTVAKRATEAANRTAGAAAQAAHDADTLNKAKAAAQTATDQARSFPPNAGPAKPPSGYRVGQSVGNVTRGVSKALPGIGGALAAANEGGDIAEVAMDKDSSKIDVAAQASEGAGKLALAGLGAKGGAMLGALGGPLAPITVPLGAAAGGAVGYFGGEKLINSLRGAVGSEASSPHEQLLARRAASAATPSPAPLLRDGADATMPGQDPGRVSAAAAAAPAAPKLGDLRETDEGAGTMQQFTKGPGGTVAGWTTVSTPTAKAERALRDQQFDAQRQQNAIDHRADTARQLAYFADQRQQLEEARPMYINARKLQNERRSQDLTLRAAMAQNETSRANNAATNQTALRGQDMELEGKRASNESAKLRLQYDMGRDARKDLVDERKFQTDEANTQFDQVIKGNEAHYKKVLNSLPPINGKSGPEANTQAAAAYMTGAHAAVAARAAKLRRAGDAAGAAALERQGTAGISATEHQNLLNGMEVMSRFKEIKGQWFTDGTKGNISNNPMDFVVVGPDPKNPKKVLLAGGQSMDMDDVTGTDTANRFGLPFWGGGQQTNQYLPK